MSSYWAGRCPRRGGWCSGSYPTLQGGLHFLENLLDDVAPTEGAGMGHNLLAVPAPLEGRHHRTPKGIEVAVRDEESVDAVAGDLRHAPHSRGDDGDSTSQRLEDDVWPPLRLGQED